MSTVSLNAGRGLVTCHLQKLFQHRCVVLLTAEQRLVACGQVICDGEPLDLPDDIEGVIFLNINSYMGGVDLWASGVSSAGSASTGKQSFCDGMLEVITSP